MEQLAASLKIALICERSWAIPRGPSRRCATPCPPIRPVASCCPTWSGWRSAPKTGTDCWTSRPRRARPHGAGERVELCAAGARCASARWPIRRARSTRCCAASRSRPRPGPRRRRSCACPRHRALGRGDPGRGPPVRAGGVAPREAGRLRATRPTWSNTRSRTSRGFPRLPERVPARARRRRDCRPPVAVGHAPSAVSRSRGLARGRARRRPPPPALTEGDEDIASTSRGRRHRGRNLAETDRRRRRRARRRPQLTPRRGWKPTRRTPPPPPSARRRRIGEEEAEAAEVIEELDADLLEDTSGAVARTPPARPPPCPAAVTFVASPEDEPYATPWEELADAYDVAARRGPRRGRVSTCLRSSRSGSADETTSTARSTRWSAPSASTSRTRTSARRSSGRRRTTTAGTAWRRIFLGSIDEFGPIETAVALHHDVAALRERLGQIDKVGGAVREILRLKSDDQVALRASRRSAVNEQRWEDLANVLEKRTGGAGEALPPATDRRMRLRSWRRSTSSGWNAPTRRSTPSSAAPRRGVRKDHRRRNRLYGEGSGETSGLPTDVLEIWAPTRRWPGCIRASACGARSSTA